MTDKWLQLYVKRPESWRGFGKQNLKKIAKVLLNIAALQVGQRGAVVRCTGAVLS